MLNVFTFFLVGNIIGGFNFYSAMFFILGVAGIIWNSCCDWMTSFFFDVALGLVFLSIFDARLVRSSLNFFAFFCELGFIYHVTFWSWLMIMMFNNWRRWRREWMSSSYVSIVLTSSFFCYGKRN